jgi:hypothetical protein
VSAVPDTPLWRELRRLAAVDGLEEIALRQARLDARAPGSSCFADLTWRGGEQESVLLQHTGDPDELARALARELGVPLDSVQHDGLPRGAPGA